MHIHDINCPWEETKHVRADDIWQIRIAESLQEANQFGELRRLNWKNKPKTN